MLQYRHATTSGEGKYKIEFELNIRSDWHEGEKGRDTQ